MAAEVATRCPKCRRLLETDRCVRLWDGHEYCIDCVSDHSRRLADFAQRHRAFVDVVQFRDVVLVWKFVVSLLVYFGLTLIVVAVFAPQIFADTLILLLLFIFCLPPAYVIQNVLAYPQTVRLADGIVRASFRSSKSVNNVASRLHGGPPERGT